MSKADIDRIQSFDSVPAILSMVCATTGMGFAAVARVTSDQWITCASLDKIRFGLVPGSELKVETTICHEIRQSGVPVIIEHVAADPLYRSHHTPLMYGFQSYISMPILKNGEFFGTLCAIDSAPAKLNNPETIGMFKVFADLIGSQLDSYDTLASTRAELKNERATAELREQFIAVLGHDLRNPLGSISAGASFLSRTPLNPKGVSMVAMIQKSVVRMSGLIDNVLDFARGRLGGGVTLELRSGRPLEPELVQVVEELRTAWPDRRIETRFSIEGDIVCDHRRIAQLLSNLIANAITHGTEGKPISVEASTQAGMFELAVANYSEPISPEAVGKLFQPFFRGTVQHSQQGLGLGLFIVSEIARAHGGEIKVTSDAEITRFVLTMPVAGDPPGISG